MDKFERWVRNIGLTVGVVSLIFTAIILFNILRDP